ncbi:MAG: C45 family peptidase, partial [Anaerolineae bacterium]
MDGSARVHSVAGSPYAVGLALGRAVGARLGSNIDTYIERGPGRGGRLDRDALREGAMPWFERLPERFREEIEGLAEGAGLPLLRLAEWCYVEEHLAGRCTSVVGRVDGRVWLGRNNDYLAVGLWGYATVRAVDGLIPTLSFGMEAEPFTVTGVNAERLWLHHHYLPARDEAAATSTLSSYV